METLAALHSIDAREIGLPQTFLRNYGSHYPRQVKTLTSVEEGQASAKNEKTGELVGHIPNFANLIDYMKTRMPPERVSIVHGDYKIDNLIFHPTENRVIAILDWELCTIGHPLADLGNLLQPYSVPPSLPSQGAAMTSLAESDIPGLPTVKEHLEIYRNAAGWDPQQYWTFAVVYAHLRLAVILHGIAARVARGQASSPYAALVAKGYPIFAGLATDAIEEEKAAKSSSKL